MIFLLYCTSPSLRRHRALTLRCPGGCYFWDALTLLVMHVLYSLWEPESEVSMGRLSERVFGTGPICPCPPSHRAISLIQAKQAGAVN